MKLLPDWRRVVRKAWSVRLMLLAGLLTGCEAVINMVGADVLPGPQWVRGLLVLVVIGAAFVSRLMAQKEAGDE